MSASNARGADARYTIRSRLGQEVDTSGDIWNLGGTLEDFLLPRWKLRIETESIRNTVDNYLRAMIGELMPASVLNAFRAILAGASSVAFQAHDARACREPGHVIGSDVAEQIRSRGDRSQWRTFYRWAVTQGRRWKGACPNFSAEVEDQLYGSFVPKRSRAELILGLSPSSGPLLDVETSALVEALADPDRSAILRLEERVAILLASAIGPRRTQMCLLRIEDVRAVEGPDGGMDYSIAIPQVKKRKYRRVREDFNEHHLTRELGVLLAKLVAKRQDDYRYRGWVAKGYGIPLFVKQEVGPGRRNPAAGSSHGDGAADGAEVGRLSGSLWRKRLRAIYKGEGGQYSLHYCGYGFDTFLKVAVGKLDVVSPRTGARLVVTCQRLRKTAATSLTLLGLAPSRIAAFLGHENTSSIMHYIDNRVALRERVNAALGPVMAARAAGFLGRTIAEDAEARLGIHPEDRIWHLAEDGSAPTVVGGCAKGSPCNDRIIPADCYACTFFRPRRDGPHEAVAGVFRHQHDRMLQLGAIDPMIELVRRTIGLVEQTVREAMAAHGCMHGDGDSAAGTGGEHAPRT